MSRVEESEAETRMRVAAVYERLKPMLPGYGCKVDALPLAADNLQLAAGNEFERRTGLPPIAFAPKKRGVRKSGIRLAPLEAAAGLVVGQFLFVGGVIGWPDQLPVKQAELSQLQSYELITLSLSILLGVTTIVALVDKLLLQERLLEALGLLLVPSRRDAAAQHEAGHFLCAYLLAVPVQACILNPARSLLDAQLAGRVGTVFLSPAIDELRAGRAADQRDVNVAAIVLMGGIAAEALANGSAEGGAADEKALAALLTAQLDQASGDGGDGGDRQQKPSPSGFFSATGLATSGPNTATGAPLPAMNNRNRRAQQAEVRARARWAAASAALLLRERRASLDALVEALREGRSVGECVWAIEAAAAQSAE